MARKDPQATKEYNRLRAAKQYEDYTERRALLMEQLGGKCYLCETPATKGFHLHHINYHVEESNYSRTSRSMSIRLKRLAEAENNSERFRALCGSCHAGISRIHESFRHMNMDRLAELIKIPVGL